MFRASQRPSSGVPKTVSATSGIGHGIGSATSFHRGLIRIPNQATVEGSSVTNTMTYTRGSRYSFWNSIPNQATVEGSSVTNTMTYTRGSRYSFWNSWGWALWRPKHVEFEVAVNKCLRTDASSWSFLLILNHDARNHEFKILLFIWRKNRNKQNIWHSEDRASWYILIIKPKRYTSFSNLFLE
jgi:hypothetical protein